MWVAGGRGGMIRRKDVVTEREGGNDEHQHFSVVLDGLVDDKFAFEEREPVLADIVSVSGVDRG
jgi:hypothetical protein